MERLFKIKRDYFPITVNYGVPVEDMHAEVLTHVKWQRKLKLKNRKSPVHLGIKNYICYYAILLRDSNLREVQKNALGNQILLADMMQLFSFGLQNVKTEVTPEKHTPIISAAIGSTWLCSHSCLNEMAGFEWDFFHHKPGPALRGVTDPLKKDTRLLAFCL